MAIAWQDHDSSKHLTDLHQMVNDAMDRILDDQSALYIGYQRAAREYLDRPVNGFNVGQWDRSDIRKPLTYNVIRSCVDTLTSNITVTLPATRILPVDAKEGVQARATKLEKLIRGIYRADSYHAIERRRVHDAALYGTGIVKVVNDGRPRAVRVHPARVIVDDNAAIDGVATTIYHYEVVARRELASRYGADNPAVRDATAHSDGFGGSDRDVVRVVDAHSVGKPHGRHVMCTDAGVLVDEVWDYALPYSRLVYSADECGWHGVGIAEIVRGIQAEINATLEAVHDNVALMAVPYWLVQAGSKIIDSDVLTNQRGRKIEYFGNVPPKIVAPPAISPQVIQHLETLYARAFELVGISQLSASSLKPAGIESGIGLLNLRDVESQRFADFARSYEEQAGITVPRLVVEAARRQSGSWSVKAAGKDFVSSITWSDVSLDDDMFDIQLYPTSSLPKDPAGRAEYVIRLAEQQLITRDDLMALLEMPDVSKTTQLANAEYNDLERTFETMLETGEYLEPLEFQNLELGVQIALRYWSRARLEDASDDRLDLLVRWMREAREISTPAPPPEAMGAPGVPTPPGGGEPVPSAMPDLSGPPTSGLML